jgi:uncharacterized membrane protein
MNATNEIPNSLPASKPTISWPHIVFAVLGIAISIYAIYAHGLIEAGKDAGCSISETISCNEVLSSKWGKFMGIPLGYFGVAFWVIVGITGITNAATSLKSATLQRFGIAAVGIVCSAFLFYVSEFLIRKVCPICFSTHTLSLLNFLYSSFALIKARKVATDGKNL